MNILFFFWLMCMFPLTIKRNGFFEDALSKERTNVLKGLSAIVIIFMHLSNLTGKGKLLSIFLHVGYLFVGIFFFISGYGLMKNYIKSGKDYLSFFLSRRLMTTIIPYALVSLIY